MDARLHAAILHRRTDCVASGAIRAAQYDRHYMMCPALVSRRGEWDDNLVKVGQQPFVSRAQLSAPRYILGHFGELDDAQRGAQIVKPIILPEVDDVVAR